MICVACFREGKSGRGCKVLYTCSCVGFILHEEERRRESGCVWVRGAMVLWMFFGCVYLSCI